MERFCAGCKRPLTAPEAPLASDEPFYCCTGCEQGTGCTCRRRALVSTPATERPLQFRLDRAIPLEAHLNDWLS
jgi:hypothetical protein